MPVNTFAEFLATFLSGLAAGGGLAGLITWRALRRRDVWKEVQRSAPDPCADSAIPPRRKPQRTMWGDV